MQILTFTQKNNMPIRIKEISTFVTSTQGYLKLIDEKFDRTGILYRGVSDEKYDLKPSVGRYHSDPRVAFLMEDKSVRNFCNEMAAFNSDPSLCFIEKLALAQHYGMPTRLLDWTTSPLTALMFAIRGEAINSAVYVLKKDADWHDERSLQVSGINGIGKKFLIYSPRHIDNRIRAQSGLFTITTDPTKSLEETLTEKDEALLFKIIILGEYKLAIRKQLINYGLTTRTVFPDLQGLCDDLRFIFFQGADGVY